LPHERLARRVIAPVEKHAVEVRIEPHVRRSSKPDTLEVRPGAGSARGELHPRPARSTREHVNIVGARVVESFQRLP
jgi:hypothetical protein